MVSNIKNKTFANFFNSLQYDIWIKTILNYEYPFWLLILRHLGLTIFRHLQEKFARFNNIAELCIVEYEKAHLDNSKNFLKILFKLRDLLKPLSLQ